MPRSQPVPALPLDRAQLRQPREQLGPLLQQPGQGGTAAFLEFPLPPPSSASTSASTRCAVAAASAG